MALPRIDKASGVVDGVNRYFNTPNPYVPGTLVVMINGRQLDRVLENGWIERDPAAGLFEMLKAPLPPQGSSDDPGDLVTAYYENALEPAGGGLEGGVPEMGSGRDVRPRICAAVDLAPGLEATGDCEAVPTIGVEQMRPRVCSAGDIRPRIEKAEEI